MSDDVPTPRSELAHLVGGSLPDRILAAENTLLFVLDGGNGFVYFDRDLPMIYDAGKPLVPGAKFRPECLVPSNLVSRSVASAQEGRGSDPFLVVARDPANQQHVWQFEVFPVSSPGMPAGHGVVCLLSRAGERRSALSLDPILYSVTLSERLERERLETTQAVAVTMRHEINNALTSLIGNAELILRRGDELDEQTADRVREIARQGRRIQTVLDRLEALTEIRTTTYYGGVQMIELGGDEPETPEEGDSSQ